MYPTQELCIAAIGSMTAAIKAERALQGAGLSVRIVSLLPEETKRGCAYGIEYPCTAEGEVRSALRNAHLTPSQFLKRGGKPL